MPPKRRSRTIAAPTLETKRARKATTRRRSEESSERDVVSAAPTSPFLALPRELRDQIYHEVWRNKSPFEVACPDKAIEEPRELFTPSYSRKYLMFKVSYEWSAKPAEDKSIWEQNKSNWQQKTSQGGTKSPWILTNQQILEEAMEQFNRQATWEYVDKRKSFEVRGKTVIASRLPPVRRRGRQRQVRQLLAFQNACDIDLGPAIETSILAQIDKKARPVHCMIFQPSAVKLFKMIGVDGGETTNLKHLDIMLYAGIHEAEHIVNPMQLDLWPLESLNAPNLQSLVLRAQISDRFRKETQSMAKLKDHLSEMGKSLIGGEVRESFEDSPDPEVAWRFIFTGLRTSLPRRYDDAIKQRVLPQSLV